MRRTRKFDLIVIGSGAGMNIAANAAGQGLRVAVVDRGPLGGTCLNRGCIPTKVMLYPADIVRMIDEAKAVGVHAHIDSVDFGFIMKRTWDIVLEGRHGMEQGVADSDLVQFYNRDGTFVADYTLQVGKEQITAPKVVIASGARPSIPPIEGLEEVGYQTSDTIFEVREPPRSLVIVGGGYIAAEFAHFFAAMGTEVTIVGRNARLLPTEEPSISAVLAKKMSTYCQVHTGWEVARAETSDGQKVVVAKNHTSGELRHFAAEEILVAAGRRSNSDILQPEKTGVQTDEQGWIVVDEYLRTTKEGIWALGDALGRHMYRHTANYHSQLVWGNAFGHHLHPVDDHAVPRAVFTHPEVASVGLTEEQAREDHDVLVGISRYSDVAKGYAMAEEDGFVKVIVDEESKAILGAHIIGPHAAMLLQPLVYLMNTQENDFWALARAQTIHPALGEVVVTAFGNLAPVGEHSHRH